ncbi:MAG: hypothetical protein R3309_11740 [Reinekea sp.]|nr:hypothetical protein [Reinekea sp.]
MKIFSIKSFNVYVTLIVAGLSLLSLFVVEKWLYWILRPYPVVPYILMYFSILWVFGLSIRYITKKIGVFSGILVASIGMHVVSVFILMVVLGLCYTDGYFERLTNSLRALGALDVMVAILVIGSFKSFILGGWIYGPLMIIFLLKAGFLEGSLRPNKPELKQ